MSKRLSNETLAKALTMATHNLQESLKIDQKARERLFHEVGERIAKNTNQIQEATSDFKPDLSEFKRLTDKHIQEIDQRAEKEAKSLLTWKAITIYLGVLALFFTASYFIIDKYQKEIAEVRTENHHFERFILEDKYSTVDFKNWMSE